MEVFIHTNNLSCCLGFLISLVSKETIHPRCCNLVYIQYLQWFIRKWKCFVFTCLEICGNDNDSSNKTYPCPPFHGHNGKSNHRQSYCKFTIDFVDVDFTIESKSMLYVKYCQIHLLLSFQWPTVLL